MYRKINLAIKRIFDIVSSIIGLLVLVPILLVIAILIKIDSDGPVFFLQERLGKNGKVFKIIKFRTMVVNAENMGDGVKVKDSEDSRITRVGKILRDTSFDEIPQLINVIKGDMSLIGPRPPVTYYPYEFEEYSEEQRKRFSFRPGITGLSQIKVRESVPWDEKIKYDIEYVSSFSTYLDFKILILTFPKVLKRDDIYLDVEKQNNKEKAGERLM